MAQALTTSIFAVHIVGGAVGMASGLTAVCARKGGRLHRTAGDVFVVSMAVMAVFAAVLGVIRPGQIINVFIAGLTLYLVLTAWLTARRRSTPPGAPSLLGRVVERKRDRGGKSGSARDFRAFPSVPLPSSCALTGFGWRPPQKGRGIAYGGGIELLGRTGV